MRWDRWVGSCNAALTLAQTWCESSAFDRRKLHPIACAKLRKLKCMRTVQTEQNSQTSWTWECSASHRCIVSGVYRIGVQSYLGSMIFRAFPRLVQTSQANPLNTTEEKMLVCTYVYVYIYIYIHKHTYLPTAIDQSERLPFQLGLSFLDDSDSLASSSQLWSCSSMGSWSAKLLPRCSGEPCDANYMRTASENPWRPNILPSVQGHRLQCWPMIGPRDQERLKTCANGNAEAKSMHGMASCQSHLDACLWTSASWRVVVGQSQKLQLLHIHFPSSVHKAVHLQGKGCPCPKHYFCCKTAICWAPQAPAVCLAMAAMQCCQHVLYATSRKEKTSLQFTLFCLHYMQVRTTNRMSFDRIW